MIESKTKSEHSRAAYVSVENLYIGVWGGVDNHCIYYRMGLSETCIQLGRFLDFEAKIRQGAGFGTKLFKGAIFQLFQYFVIILFS